MDKSLNGIHVRHSDRRVGTIWLHSGDNFRVEFNKDCFTIFSIDALEKVLFGFSDKDRNAIGMYLKQFKNLQTQPLRKDAIKKIIAKRGIQHLIHFTRKENLENIRKYGLLPLNLLREQEIKFIQNDKKRIDGTQAICMSITRPNWPLFQRFMQLSGDDNFKWVALKLDATKVLTNCICKFCPVNAATDSGGHIQEPLSPNADDLEKLFERTNYAEKCLPDYLTSDPQAEVLVFSKIPYDYVEAVIEDPTYFKIVGDDIMKSCSGLSSAKHDKTYSIKARKCMALFGKAGSDEILFITDGSSDILASFAKVKDYVGYNKGIEIIRDKSIKSCLKHYRGLVFLDKDLIDKEYEYIVFNDCWLSVRNTIQSYSPYLI